jgi:hypothetical protein
VEQGGSAGWCSSGVATYTAWYEFYPQGIVNISSISVHPNDTISVNVTYNPSTSKFTIAVSDRGQNPYSITGANSGARDDSAECIVERAHISQNSYAHLADFSIADLGLDYTSSIGCSATASATQGPLSVFSTIEPVTMFDSSGYVMASPSFLSSDGTSFEVTWHLPS